MAGRPDRGRRRTEPLRAERVVDVRDVAAPIDLTAEPLAAAGERWVAPRRRILIVDDEPDVRGWLRIALEPLRWDVNGAGTASDGIEMATRLLPDVVLLDQQLPDGTGLEVGRWLRTNQPAMSLVMFSAYLDLRTEEEAERLGIRTISKVEHHVLISTLGAIRLDLDARTRANNLEQ